MALQHRLRARARVVSVEPEGAGRRVLLLNGTYEERIFHTVVQRDQRFEILIGSKKRELGKLPENIEEEVAQDKIEDHGAGGALTDAEKARVMLDLRPE